jgi:DNA-binding GntR family transcriptional regulator
VTTEAKPDPSGTTRLRIAARLREAIIQGRFLPGEALKIRDLAEAFGTSTQPVRGVTNQ